MTKIILLAHGSPDPRSGEAISIFAEKIQRLLNISTDVAYLDHQGPALHDLAQENQSANVLVVPMLLSNAFHARFDVPKAMAHSGLTHVMPPIGHPLKVLGSLIKSVGPHAIVVSAGNSNDAERQLFQDAVDLSCIGSGIHARSAFVSGSGPSLNSQLESTSQSNDSPPTIIPWLLAPGRLLDSLLGQADDYGAHVEGAGLVEEPIFLQHIGTSIQLFLQSEFYPRLEAAR